MLGIRVLTRPKNVFSPHFYSMGLNLWVKQENIEKTAINFHISG